MYYFTAGNIIELFSESSMAVNDTQIVFQVIFLTMNVFLFKKNLGKVKYSYQHKFDTHILGSKI